MSTLLANFCETALADMPFLYVKADFRSAHSREFVYYFCFVSCKTSQNVAFRIYLHEVNSKFHVNRHKSMKLLEKEFERSQR